ncbi:MAG: 2,3-bisphosphoglycerate-independent phosphoglycerate mutase, partial [Desulfohalobium sp.]
QAVDACAGRVVQAVLESGGRVLLTADHGNADVMQGENGTPYTAHSQNPVPFVCIDRQPQDLRFDGVLGDIAPTLLELWKMEPPAAMTGHSLLQHATETGPSQETP